MSTGKLYCDAKDEQQAPIYEEMHTRLHEHPISTEVEDNKMVEGKKVVD